MAKAILWLTEIKFNKYIIIGIILILFAIIGGNYKLLLNYFNDKQEEKMIQEFYQDDLSNEETEQENIESDSDNKQAENKKINYVAVLKINKINCLFNRQCNIFYYLLLLILNYFLKYCLFF